jgi:hypothetical protein
MFKRGVSKPFIMLLVLFALRKWEALGQPIPTSLTPPDGGRCSPHYAIHQWTSANGLPASTIQCLLQTRDGYLWIGTRNGLVRFNGKDFRIFSGINCFALPKTQMDSFGLAVLRAWRGGTDMNLGAVIVRGRTFQTSNSRSFPFVPAAKVEFGLVGKWSFGGRET